MQYRVTPPSVDQLLNQVVHRPLSLISQHPLLSLFFLLVLLPPTLLLSIAIYLFSLSTYRLLSLHVLGTDAYSHFPRPSRTDRYPLLTGNLGFIRRSPPTEGHLSFVRQLQTRLYVYRGLFYTPRLFIADPRAMLHMLSSANSYNYEKPLSTRLVLKNFLGEGVLVAEGEVHKRQRKILQPAFNVGSIRELNPIFMKYSRQLAEKISTMIDLSSSSTSEKKEGGADGVHTPFVAQSKYALEASTPGNPVLDIGWWTTRAALDIIGDAGFGYHFQSLEVSPDPAIVQERAGDVLGNAFNTLFKLTLNIDIVRFLQIFLSNFALLRWVDRIPSNRKRATEKAYKVLEEVSQEIVDRKKAEIRSEMAAEVEARKGGGGGGFTKADFDEKDSTSSGSGVGKDLLHLMMRANMAADVSPKEKLDDAELIGQITTLLIAGHETTSNQTAWTLWLLAQQPFVQDKLREEIHDHLNSTMDRDPNYDELMSMPYLDAVCKESFRCKSAVPNTIRVAKVTADIPLSRAYPDRKGKATITSVHIPKGREVLIPIQAINSDPEIWGEDAAEFKPERWLDLAESAKQNGLPMHLMTFISGPRACIGNRFALAEFKAILCHLVGRFKFQVVEGWEVEAKQTAVIRSRVVGQEDVGPQMPLRVSHLNASEAK
ncbi:related to Cytochrome P450 [Ustilago sp. UG-2017b]|nr:related to Cytochrome P450 [Ustilago sp. UG-2017b]